MKNLLLLSFTFFSSLVLAQGQQQNVHIVPAIEVSGLKNYQGQYLSLAFVNATPSPVAVDLFRIQVKQVNVAPKELLITEDTMVFSPTSIPVRSLYAPYNYAFLVVSSNPNFSWMNSDGTLPLPAEFQTTNHEVLFFRPIPRRLLIKDSTDENIRVRLQP